MTNHIPGYNYGSASLQKSPVSMDDFAKLKQASLFDEDDIRYLKMSLACANASDNGFSIPPTPSTTKTDSIISTKSDCAITVLRKTLPTTLSPYRSFMCTTFLRC
ncbi:hypothetical protein [Nitrosomonas supralitoralis]|uniref:hypothetical protein n=1 Tax=Nitrosomonas supralitoralis TaxID=2116706 RepID=UPI001F5BA96E|nr:hypothetical protein [Nitrosomonas supralitoralis]